MAGGSVKPNSAARIVITTLTTLTLCYLAIWGPSEMANIALGAIVAMAASAKAWLFRGKVEMPKE